MVSKSAIAPRLVIIEGKDKGKVISLKNGAVVIGRSKGDVLLQDSRVSRSHATVHYDESSGRLTFTDLKSLNGTLVNGVQKDSGELNDGDKLQLGNTLFDCQINVASEEHSQSSSLHSLSGNQVLEPEIESIQSSRPEPSIQEDREPTIHRGIFPRLRKAYGGLSPKTRTVLLSALLIYLVFTFMTTGGGGADALNKELAAIRLLETQGRIEEALSKAVELKKQYPNNSRPYILLGDLYSGQKRFEASISAYQKAHEFKPNQPLVHLKLVRAYQKTGLAREALEESQHVDDSIKNNPHDKELFVETARFFLENRDLKDAPEKALILAKALENNVAPNDPIGYKLEAQAMFQITPPRVEDALKAMEKGHKLASDDEWLLENIAFARLTLKDMAGAASMVEQWLRTAPNSSKALLVMAYLKFNDKNYAGALPYVQRIIAANRPNDTLVPEALHLSGQIYFSQNQLAEAQAAFQKACERGYAQSCEQPLLKGTTGSAQTNQAPNQ